MRVTYDPLHPAVVLAADADVAPTDGSDWLVGLLLAVLLTLGAGALGARVFSLTRGGIPFAELDGVMSTWK